MKIGVDLIPITGREAGLQRYAQQLVEGLTRCDRETTYTIIINEKAKNLLNIDQPNFRVILVKTPPKIHFFWEQVYLPLRTLLEDLDVLHSPVSAPPYIKLTSVRTVVTAHDLTFILYPETMKTLARGYWNFFMKRGIQKADRVITTSQSTKTDLMEYLHIPEEQIRVIPMYPDRRFIGLTERGEAAHRDRIRDKYKLPDTYILYVGTLEPRKNLVRLIKAYAQARRDSSINQSLVIAGKKGWLYDSIFEIVKALQIENEVVFTGFVDDEDLPALYSQADLFVYPSLYEGFGLPPLEAMACGTPVLTSKCSSLPEVVGDAGLLVDPKNVDEIAKGILRVLRNRDLREELREKGLERAKCFSPQRAIEATIEVYREAAELR